MNTTPFTEFKVKKKTGTKLKLTDLFLKIKNLVVTPPLAF